MFLSDRLESCALKIVKHKLKFTVPFYALDIHFAMKNMESKTFSDVVEREDIATEFNARFCPLIRIFIAEWHL